MKIARRTSLFIPMVIWTLVVTILPIAWVPQVGMAMLAPATPTEAGSGSDRTQDLQSVQRMLENKLIQQRLEDFGLTPEEVNAKLAGLSDVQLHQMAAQMDALMPGGDIGLITLLVIVLIILLIVILI